MYVKIKFLGGVLSGSLSVVSKPNFVRTSEVRKMKEKFARKYSLELALDEIYKIHMLLHRSNLNMSAISRRIFGVFKIRNAKKFNFPDFAVIFADCH